MLAVTAQLSAAIKTMANNRAASGEAVVLVEVKDGFDNDLMTIDGVHPNPVGEAHIANKMLTALNDLGVCGSNPSDVQPPITYISVPSEAGEQLAASPTLSGTALDEGGSGIDRVRIAISNSDNQWWNHLTGTFGAQEATLSSLWPWIVMIIRWMKRLFVAMVSLKKMKKYGLRVHLKLLLVRLARRQLKQP